MASNRTVNVIMPACNSQSFIARSVKSVLEQTYTNWKLIIIADDLFDYKPFLYSKGINDERISFLSTGKFKSGISSARNIGLNFAKDEIIALLDSDDTFMPTKLELMLPKTIEHGVSSCAMNYKLDNGVLITRVGDQCQAQMLRANEYLFINFSGNSMIMLDTARVPLLYDETFLVLEDLLFAMSCYDYVDKIYHFNEPLHNYYHNSSSISNDSSSSNLYIETKRKIIQKIDKGELQISNPLANNSLKEFLTISVRCEIDFQELKKTNKELTFTSYLKENLGCLFLNQMSSTIYKETLSSNKIIFN